MISNFEKLSIDISLFEVCNMLKSKYWNKNTEARKQIMEQLTISITELSKVLGVSKPIAYRLANSKGFPVLQIGSRKVIPVKKLEKWLEENTGFVGGEK